MKKLSLLFFVAFVSIAFVACGDSKDLKDSQSESNESMCDKTDKECFVKECEQGNVTACDTLGDMYFYGEDYEDYDDGSAVLTERDEKQAKIYHQKACDLGSAYGCASLGYNYAPAGEETPYFDKACAMDKTGEICEMIGRKYWANDEWKKATLYYSKGCDKNSAKSCDMAGYLWWKEFQDTQKSIEFHKKGCHLGLAVSCYNLAFSYEKGWFGEPDERIMSEYYSKACDLGHKQSCFKR